MQGLCLLNHHNENRQDNEYVMTSRSKRAHVPPLIGLLVPLPCNQPLIVVGGWLGRYSGIQDSCQQQERLQRNPKNSAQYHGPSRGQEAE